jgi:hypothetical protein
MGLRAVLGSVLHEMNIKNNGVCKMGKRALGQYVHFTGIHISIHFESDVSFWVVTPCSVAIGYRRFGGPCCVHIQAADEEITQAQPRRPHLESSPP